ncbi:E2/UBC family protein [Maribacter sp. CXY002]|uniref:E2/UBC family protein n=1 Tax=Maribacter luteocoastalis TaxID=3407671 RepID=UPI003B68338D
MIEYKEALERVSSYIKKREKVRELSDYYKKKIGLPENLDIWEISTEILDKRNKIKHIRFHIVFFPDFPLSFPKLLLSKEDFEDMKYIPHLQVDRLICIFQNYSEPNIQLPEKVVEEAIRRAKNILEDGIKGENDKDYEDEFEAYWDSNYSKNDIVNTSFLLLNEKPLKQNFDLISLEKPINKFRYVIHQNEDIALNFKAYLKDQNIKYQETTGFLTPELNIFSKPPFNKTNKEIFDAIEKLDNEDSQEYISFINDKSDSKLFLFSKEINSEIRYFGWFHSEAKLNRNGFRQKSLNNYKALSTFQSTQQINRVTPQVYTNQRLLKRSAGEENNQNNNKFVLAGVGSIGSNLIHYLNSVQGAEFKLIDTDSLELENIGRHYLGFKYLNWKKTKAIKDFLTQFSPIQKVETREKSIVQVVKDDSQFINESDFLFVAIGESNIESWIVNAIDDGLIIKPTFFLWVEPYLLGGHCIYINPKNNNYTLNFTENGLFKFNIVGDYNNKILSLKEAGCQSNYTPYSSNNIQLFLGNMYSKISAIMVSESTESTSFTWVGDKTIAEKLNIELSQYSLNYESNSLIKNNL